MAVSLASCGGGGDNKSNNKSKVLSREEMLKVATEVSIPAITYDFEDNIVKAKKKYCNKIFTVWGFIQDIGENYVELNSSTSLDCVRAYLPDKELIKLDKSDAIQVVGIITGSKEESEQYFEDTFNYNVISMKNAHFITDVYKINNRNIDSVSYVVDENNYECGVVDSNFGVIKVVCEDSVDFSAIDKIGEHFKKYTITATGKLAHKEGVVDENDNPIVIMRSKGIKFSKKK